MSLNKKIEYWDNRAKKLKSLKKNQKIAKPQSNISTINKDIFDYENKKIKFGRSDYSSISFNNSEFKSAIKFLSFFVLFSFLGVFAITYTPNVEANSNKNDASLENSKRVYNLGYSDGQMAFGLPASDRASAFEVHMAKGYNFSKIDYLVYKMGYDDGQFGRKKREAN